MPDIIKFKEPWGFSKLDCFRACKAKFRYQFIDKLPQPGSKAMERGDKIHKGIESYLNGWKKDLPPEALEWKEEIDRLKASDFKGEQAIGLDKDWKHLPSWFAPTTWVRIKMDSYYIENDTGYAIDFKTGKYRIPSSDQVELYAIGMLSIAPYVNKVHAQMWFIDTGDMYEKVYTKDQLIQLRSKYQGEAAVMYTEEQWEPEPSEECRYCPYSRTKNGPCKY